ncbi:MAG TPA: metallophosphoesterase family protein [Burkholderiales bacterium]|nr:metallophosphoesterase family protein [Burkholderiales bacterium]
MPVTIGVRKPTPPLILAMPWSSIRIPRASRSTSLPKSSIVAAPLSNRHSIKRIGVISDTHGVIRDEALAALQDSELIRHAGDIGAPECLRACSKRRSSSSASKSTSAAAEASARSGEAPRRSRAAGDPGNPKSDRRHPTRRGAACQSRY